MFRKAGRGEEETVQVVRGFGPDGAQPPARGEVGEQCVSRVAGVGHYLTSPTQGPGGMQVVEGWQIAADHLLCRADDPLQPALILGCGYSVPDGDGGGEDGLHDGGVEVLHHCLWQVTFLQLPQEEHPLLGFFDEGAGVLLPFDLAWEPETETRLL